MTLSDLKANCAEYSRLGKGFDRSLRRFAARHSRSWSLPTLRTSTPCSGGSIAGAVGSLLKSTTASPRIPFGSGAGTVRHRFPALAQA